MQQVNRQPSQTSNPQGRGHQQFAQIGSNSSGSNVGNSFGSANHENRMVMSGQKAFEPFLLPPPPTFQNQQPNEGQNQPGITPVNYV